MGGEEGPFYAAKEVQATYAVRQVSLEMRED